MSKPARTLRLGHGALLRCARREKLTRVGRKRDRKAEVGFEPTNNGFAIRPLSPLGYSALFSQQYKGCCTRSSQVEYRGVPPWKARGFPRETSAPRPLSGTCRTATCHA